MRSISIGTGCEDVVRGIRSRPRIHGRICRGHAGRPLSRRVHVPNERVRVQARQTGCRRWSVDRYASTPKQCISTFTRHIFHSSKMYACTATRIDVGSLVTPYGKKRLCCAGMSARVRGVCIESILVACTIRLHRCSNVSTTRTFVWLNRCATIRIEPPLTSRVG